MNTNQATYNLIAHYWPAFTNGSQPAFTAIYNNSFELLYKYGLKFIQDEDDLQDVIQDLFVHIWQKRKELKTVKQPYFYLLTCIRNALLDKLRKERMLSFEEVNEQYNFQLNCCIEEQLIYRENQHTLERDFKNALTKLTPKQREIIYLRYVKQIDYDQVAQIMGITIKGAYKLQARAIDCLRQQLNKLDYACVIALLWLLVL